MKNFTLKISLVVLAATLTAPLFASAQTGVSITKAELDAMDVLEDQLTFIETTAPEYAGLLDQAMRMCGALGDKIYSITSNAESTSWGEFEEDCGATAVIPNTTVATDTLGILVGRPYAVVGTLSFLEQHLINLKTDPSAAPITAERYIAMKKQADSAGSFDWLGRIVVWIFKFVSNIIASILAFLATFAMWLLNIIIQNTTNTLSPKIIESTWRTVRDFMNLFFIVSLIVMALATILRREEYNYKQLLFRLILMALLINFSLIIAKTMVDFSDMLIRLFRPDGGFKDYAALFYKGFVFHGDVSFGNFFGQGDTLVDGIGDSVTKLMSLVFLVVAIVAISILMFVRLVGLWFLMMVSPVAYALNILPGTRKHALLWWTTFIKYLIWGPVAMFFFRIGFVLIRQAGQNTSTDPILSNLMVAAFVWAGFLAAKSAGMIGATAIVGYAEKFAKQGSQFAATGYGNLFWRGSAATGAGALANRVGLTGIGSSLQTLGTNIGKTTAKISGAAKAPQEALARSNRARVEQVKKSTGEWQTKYSNLKNVDKDSVGMISGKNLYDMVARGDSRINENLLRVIQEHGTRGQKDALMLAAHDGRFAAHEFNGASAELEETVRRMHYLAAGGKENDDPERYRNARVEVRVTGNVPQLSGNMTPEQRLAVRTTIINEHRFDNRRAVVTYPRRRDNQPPQAPQEPAQPNVTVNDADLRAGDSGSSERLSGNINERRRAAGLPVDEDDEA